MNVKSLKTSGVMRSTMYRCVTKRVIFQGMGVRASIKAFPTGDWEQGNKTAYPHKAQIYK